MAQLSIRKEVFSFLNISLYLHQIKPIRSLYIENASEELVENVTVHVFSDLPVIQKFEYDVKEVPPRSELRIPLENFKVNRDFLNTISETETAVVTAQIEREGEVLLTENWNLDVHPIEYFGGFVILPELIASYITPNHPYVYKIKRKAIEILEKEKLPTSFEGYQRNDPERVLQMLSAIYSAIQSEQIVYSALPPGYEVSGQRLRLLTTLQNEKFGNCIDLSLLFAACLEAIGLNPLLILTHGHAFVGCWLHDERFPEIINDDKTAITKRLSKGTREMVAWEATSITKGSNFSFGEALNMGESQLVEKDDFEISIDVKRARTFRIRPLPLAFESNKIELDEEKVEQREQEAMQTDFDLGNIYADELQNATAVTSKLKNWERKLLDLSLRNNLLNLRITRNMLQLVDMNLNELEDTLWEGKSFSIQPNPNAEVQRRYNIFNQPLHHSSQLYQLANEELKYNRLLTYYHRDDLSNILTYIHRNARQAIEENGSSTLYLAVGLLKWFDKKTPTQPRFSPILLIPVEISRRSVRSNFTLRGSEEETMINITLVEFLKQEYDLNLQALENLPYDDKGVDVAKVMGILRRAIMQMQGWDVEERVVLGNFSFSKLILWKDIVSNQEKLLESDMVKSLVDGKLAFTPSLEEDDQNYDEMPSENVTLTIPTDVSQLEAVLSAQKGETFILHGPPGTGKSQTITNIIADALHQGKRVLFVAAKKAALDVVHRRLEQIGLGSFTLELHSNKAKKSDILAQLDRSLQAQRLSPEVQFARESRRLDVAKKYLNAYVSVLHEKQKIGWSLYESIVGIDKLEGKDLCKDLVPEEVFISVDEDKWIAWNDWLNQYEAIISVLNHPKENPLRNLGIKDYSYGISEQIAAKSTLLSQSIAKLSIETEAVVKSVYFPAEVLHKESWSSFQKLVAEISNVKNIPLELLQFLAAKENAELFDEWKTAFGNYQNSLNGILKDYRRNVLDQNISEWEMQWRKAEQSWFLPKWLQKNKLKKNISLYRKQPVKDDNDMLALFNNYQKYTEDLRLVQQERFTVVKSALKNLYKDEQTDIAQIRDISSEANSVMQLFNFWGSKLIHEWIKSLTENGYTNLSELNENNREVFRSFQESVEEYRSAEQEFFEVAKITYEPSENWMTGVQEQLQDINQHLPNLKDWILYVHLVEKGNDIDMNWLTEAYLQKRFDKENSVDYFQYTVHRSVARDVISAHKSLNLFNASVFNSKIEKYKKIATNYRDITLNDLKADLSARLPNPTIEAIQSSEIGILQRNIRNRGRGTSIRRLFDQIPTLLPRLAPCILMSPISVAQYFDVDNELFDLLIFDEASQLPTFEAVSSLARAKQAIIVGDPKQMPPTSFFSTIKVDEENMDVEDLESILDDSLALSIPSKYLLRHYRSKHESLIAFSNSNYYDNKLLTFPSHDDLDKQVKHHAVDGFYDKGRSRTNRFEADAIVQFVEQHYADTAKRKRSIGIVTFSQTQQNLIEEKLQELYSKNTELERWATESEEPLFVKNLENVQGDERDFILFSIGYGPDKEGKVSMNFGPLNRNGGWRRLNVAVTRSRFEMHVFATLKAEQIDLSRTSAEGVAGLKAFLNYAEKGYLPLNADAINTADRKSLAVSIAAKLQENNLVVKTDIGTSDFKVDIGVVNPNNPSQYILGILLDGYYYHQARTTNDREMVMPSVLSALGWKIHKIWTMDWYENQERIVSEITEKVNAILEDNYQVEDIPESETDHFALEEEFDATLDESHEPIPVVRKQDYIITELNDVPEASSETIYDFKNRNLLRSQILQIVETESPISKNLLYRRLLNTWNISRVGAKLDRHLQEIIAETGVLTTSHHQEFYWKPGADFSCSFYRDNHVVKRSVEDIAPEEILIALEEALSGHLSIEKADLMRYLTRTFGYAKMGMQIESLMDSAVKYAVAQGVADLDGDRVKIGSN
ncbi:MAG: DUF3320 domain-containing protein [Weeksellaceae bacterium]|nr:DUF3320 domain-containing protein [Weeksellaceae bacterium]